MATIKSSGGFPRFSGLLDVLGDRNVDDDLLRHLVSSVYAADEQFVTSLLMGAGLTTASYAFTHANFFLYCCFGHLLVGAGRYHCMNDYRRRATPQDSRATTLGFDRAIAIWATLYSALLGIMCYALVAAPNSYETLPLAIGTAAGFTTAYVTRNSGRLVLLISQALATAGPACVALIIFPVLHGAYYCAMLVALSLAVIWLGRSSRARIIELFQANNRNEQLARFDMLTGVMNRFAFAEALDRALAEASPSKVNRFALVSVDLDRFKEINDTFGHAAGDAVIIEAASRLREIVRPGDFVARLGGDEFVILTRGAQVETATAETMARRVSRALSKPFQYRATPLPSSASVGVALFPDHGDSSEDLMRHADAALYEAKRGGRGRYVMFNEAMRERLDDARALDLELARAIERDEFEAWYQPIHNIETGMVTGYEALARWRHPVRGLVAPAHFIPMAEQSGAIVGIGELILRKACEAAAQWDPSLTVAVNLSPGQFRNPEALVEDIKSALRISNLDPSRLFIEITESLLMEDTPKTRAAITQLSAHGVRFSLDDFGVGYSSLSYLQSYPFSKIKIDKKFVDRIDTDQVSTAIIASVCVLADRISMDIVAEGVETRLQQNELRRLGIKLAQGYLYGAPAPQTATLRPRLTIVSSN